MARMPLPTPTLHTAGLRLRPFTDADADVLFALHSNAHVLRYWDSPPWDAPARAERFVAACRQMAEEGTGARLAMGRHRVVPDGASSSATVLDHLCSTARATAPASPPRRRGRADRRASPTNIPLGVDADVTLVFVAELVEKQAVVAGADRRRRAGRVAGHRGRRSSRRAACPPGLDFTAIDEPGARHPGPARRLRGGHRRGREGVATRSTVELARRDVRRGGARRRGFSGRAPHLAR